MSSVKGSSSVLVISGAVIALTVSSSYAFHWDNGGESVIAPVNATDDIRWASPNNWSGDTIPFIDPDSQLGDPGKQVFLNFGPEIIVDAEVPPAEVIFLACRDDGPDSGLGGIEAGPCFGNNNTLKVESGGVLNTTQMRTGAFGLDGATLVISGDGRVFSNDGLFTNQRNRLRENFYGTQVVYAGDQYSDIFMSDNGYFHVGNSREATGIVFGPDETNINLSGSAQLIAPNGIFTHADIFTEDPEPLYDLDQIRFDIEEGNAPFLLFGDNFNATITISDNAELRVGAEFVDEVLADIYITQGLIQGEGITFRVEPDGIELMERDDEGFFGVLDVADALVFFVESSGLPEDFSGNGVVDFTDFVMFSNSFGQDVPPGDAKFDLDVNGNIGFSDFVRFSNAFGNAAAVASVPEPASLLTAGFGMLLLCLARRYGRTD